MRLTLRTLLAYLDHVLDPGDEQDLRDKIQQSELAAGLVKRIEANLERPTGLAPAVEGGSEMDDPNTVAEYLDNTLPPEQVPEFERMCLDSDTHLEEVAACHQVLTLVVGARAAVAPTTRERIHGLAEKAADREVSVAEPSAPSSDDTRWRDEQVESGTEFVDPANYQGSGRSGGRRRLSIPLLVVGLIAIFFGLLALQPDLAERLKSRWFGSPVAEVASQLLPETRPEPAQVGESTAGESAADLPTLEAELVVIDDDGIVVPAAALEPQSAPWSDELAPVLEEPAEAAASGPTDLEPAAGLTLNPPQRSDLAAGSQVAPAASTLPLEAPEPGPLAEDSGRVTEPLVIRQPNRLEGAPPLESQVDPAPNRGVASLPDAPDDIPLPELPTAVAIPETLVETDVVEPQVPPTEPEQPVARPDALTAGLPVDSASDGGVVEPDADVPPLAATQPPNLVWTLASDREVLVDVADLQDPVRVAMGQKLPDIGSYVVLPTYRPELINNQGVRILLPGPGHLRRNGTPAAQAAWTLTSGRMLVRLAGGDTAELKLRLADRLVTLQLTQANSGVALEVRNVLPVGQNPEGNVADVGAAEGAIPERLTRKVVMLRLIDGAATVTTDVLQPRVLAVGQEWILVDANPGFERVTESTWTWVDQTDDQPIDQRASRELEPFLPAGQSLLPTLRSRAADRRVEQQSLASRCLAELGEFDAVLETINQVGQRSYWASNIQSLREAVARGKETAQDVRRTAQQLRGSEGGMIYRMLWGYSQADLDRGEAVNLVRSLSHEQLDIRVLAIENLNAITAARSHYHPHYPKSRRRNFVRSWERRLQNGEIRYAAASVDVPQAPETTE